jgi:hypothetical protein
VVLEVRSYRFVSNLGGLFAGILDIPVIRRALPRIRPSFIFWFGPASYAVFVRAGVAKFHIPVTPFSFKPNRNKAAIPTSTDFWPPFRRTNQLTHSLHFFLAFPLALPAALARAFRCAGVICRAAVRPPRAPKRRAITRHWVGVLNFSPFFISTQLSL